MKRRRDVPAVLELRTKPLRFPPPPFPPPPPHPPPFPPLWFKASESELRMLRKKSSRRFQKAAR